MEETKTLSPHMQGKVLQLDYDFITSQEGCCCYCLTDAQVQMILGMTDYLGWTTRWYSADGLIDKQVILDLQGGLVDALMSGCGCNDPFQSRVTADGHYQISSDGGATWMDSTSSDPRYTAPQSPPNLPPGTIDATCTYADSFTKFFKQGFVDVLTEGQTVEQIVAVLVGIMLAVFGTLTSGLAAILLPIFGAIAVAIVATGVSAFQAAFTSDVWDRLRCLVSENINNDGSFTQAQVDAIYDGIAETGIALIVLHSWIASLGITGMTNAARTGHGSAIATCCPACDASIWSITSYSGVPIGSILSRGANYIIVQGSSHPDFGTPYNVMLTTNNDNNCCIPVSVEWLTGDGINENIFGVDCGSPRWPGTANSSFDMGVTELNTLFFRKDSGSNFTAKVTFG